MALTLSRDRMDARATTTRRWSSPATILFLVNSGTSLPVLRPWLPPAPKLEAAAGLQAGYNWQVAPVWVVGFETDFNWSGQEPGSAGGQVIRSGRQRDRMQGAGD